MKNSRDSAAPRRGLNVVRVLAILLVATSAASAMLLASRHWQAPQSRFNPPLTKIEFEGGSRKLSRGDITGALAPFAGKGFFDIELDQAREAVEALQWVASAAVGRHWPDTLRVRVVEETVIARWGDDQVITQRAKVIRPEPGTIDGSLPRLDGPADSQFEVMRQYQRLNQILYPAGLRLTGLSASPRRSWRLRLQGDTEVVLGSEDLVGRLQRYVDFRRGLPEQERNRHAVADLRYGSQISIKLKEEQAAAELARR